MANVLTHMTMSLDGYIADPDDQDRGHLPLEDPVVVQGRRALHLRYPVRR